MKLLLYFALIFNLLLLISEEMIFGKEIINEDMIIIFEAAPKDTIFPEGNFLKESETDIHIEMLINWSSTNTKGSPVGGFIPYLNVIAKVANKNGMSKSYKLTPHLNISDNFHYAQNIKLPGEIDDIYDVTIEIAPPKENELGIHFDWKKKHKILIDRKTFKYKNLSFKEIALKSRR